MSRVVNINKYNIKKIYFTISKNFYNYNFIIENKLIMIRIPLLICTITIWILKIK